MAIKKEIQNGINSKDKSNNIFSEIRNAIKSFYTLFCKVQIFILCLKLELDPI